MTILFYVLICINLYCAIGVLCAFINKQMRKEIIQLYKSTEEFAFFLFILIAVSWPWWINDGNHNKNCKN